MFFTDFCKKGFDARVILIKNEGLFALQIIEKLIEGRKMVEVTATVLFDPKGERLRA